MTLQELTQELTMLANLRDALGRFQGLGANNGPLLEETNRRAVAAINQAAADPGDEWLFVHSGDASVLDAVGEVEFKVAALFGTNAVDHASWGRLQRGGIGLFCPGPHRSMYFLGRFPRGTIKV